MAKKKSSLCKFSHSKEHNIYLLRISRSEEGRNKSLWHRALSNTGFCTNNCFSLQEAVYREFGRNYSAALSYKGISKKTITQELFLWMLSVMKRALWAEQVAVKQEFR